MAAMAVLTVLGGCSAWPTGSYVALGNDNDASALAPAIVDPIVKATQPGQTVRLDVPGGEEDILTAMILADLTSAKINLVNDRNATHQVDYIATPIGRDEMIRVTIDRNQGGAQLFHRDKDGYLQPGGPFMEVSQQ
jgi:hypothetical protein